MKNLDVRSATLDELAYAYAQVDATIRGYEALGIDVPEALKGQLKDIRREADEQVRGAREAELVRLQARRNALKTPDEKRNDLDAKIAELTAKLA